MQRVSVILRFGCFRISTAQGASRPTSKSSVFQLLTGKRFNDNSHETRRITASFAISAGCTLTPAISSQRRAPNRSTPIPFTSTSARSTSATAYRRIEAGPRYL